MVISLIAVGKKMPHWIEEGFHDYAKRLPSDYKLQLVEIAACKRSSGSDTSKVMRQEGEQMLATLPANSYIIALDAQGEQWDTLTLAAHLQKWRDQGQPISLLVGGPEGLAPSCRQRAHKTWSLSLLTFPHTLVRVLVAEQLYRAWSILAHHPYHRN